jgi:ABC-2 type transport system ATP-binding protein/lipopolysaccharide transport system ATP-binding protein
MEARISLRDVHVEFPIYQGGSRSLKKNLLWRGTGGNVARDARQRTYVTALAGLNLDITHGDRIGLIGHNGAGKTTLLRVLAGVYEPTQGHIRVEGEVCPLFDISLGMEWDASGYDNILLRGLYLGLSRREVQDRMAAIAAYTELGDYLDMPVRTYSAGMKLRLAFATSTSVDSDIMLIDEGIIAGDQWFLAKARERLARVVDSSSIMVLATHDSGMLREWCNVGIWLQAGRLVQYGPIEDVLRAYEEDGTKPRQGQ